MMETQAMLALPSCSSYTCSRTKESESQSLSSPWEKAPSGSSNCFCPLSPYHEMVSSSLSLILSRMARDRVRSPRPRVVKGCRRRTVLEQISEDCLTNPSSLP